MIKSDFASKLHNFGANKYSHWAQRRTNIESTLIQRMTLNQRRSDCLGAVSHKEFELEKFGKLLIHNTVICNYTSLWH